MRGVAGGVNSEEAGESGRLRDGVAEGEAERVAEGECGSASERLSIEGDVGGSGS